MKLRISIILATVVLLFSCRGDNEDDVQIIDQVLMMYVKSSTNGQDLLNPKIKNSYSNVTLLDLLDPVVAQKPISGQTFPKDADTIVYMDYAAGAIRLKIDSQSNESEQTYYSKFLIKFSVKDAVLPDDYDTIRIEYKSTPSLFQISNLWYNDKLKFTKVPGKRNIVTIVK